MGYEDRGAWDWEQVPSQTMKASRVTTAHPWNRCDDCGKFIPYDDFLKGAALRRLLEPDSDLGAEKYETLCREHNRPSDQPSEGY